MSLESNNLGGDVLQPSEPTIISEEILKVFAIDPKEIQNEDDTTTWVEAFFHGIQSEVI